MSFRERSGHLEIFRGSSAAVGDQFIFDHLSLVESAETGTLHRRDVNEHVLVAGLGPDEPVTLRRVEPLDGAFLHRRSPGLLLSVYAHVAMRAARRATTRLL